MSPPRHHAAPMGLAGVLFGFTCYKHAAPTELEHPSANAVPPERGDFGLRVSDLPFAGIVAAMG